MTIFEGKKGTITARDAALMESVFFARYLDNAQVHRLHFTSSSRTRTRLYKLQEKGAVKALNFRDSLGRPRVCWRLTREGFETVAADLDYDERWTPKQLGPERLRHHVATNEVLVAARRPFTDVPSLDETLGPYPNWEWLHEARSADAYEYAGEEYRYQPDAEVWFCGSLFIVERQTKLSRVKPGDIDQKIAAHGTYLRYGLDEQPAEAAVLFACDDRRVAKLAESAGRKYAVDVVAGTSERIGDYLCQTAARLG